MNLSTSKMIGILSGIIILLCALIVVLAIVNRNLRYENSKLNFMLYTPSDAIILNQKSPILPNIALVSLKGDQKTTIYDFLGKQSIILFVFSTDCYSCDQMATVWNDIFRAYRNRVAIVGISKHPVAAIMQYISRNRVEFPVYKYGEIQGIDPFGTLPLTMFLESNGKIKWSIPGINQNVKNKIMEEI